ncbi:MAG: Rid family detoxifying hydrolase [Muribaculaceae bacterium]
MKKEITSNKLPIAVGPYSAAIEMGNMIFVSGQLPINAETGLMPIGVAAQTKQALANIKIILAEAGLSLDNVVKSTVVLAEMSLFSEMNEVYASEFKSPFPARSAFAVKELPKRALVEIEVIACRD